MKTGFKSKTATTVVETMETGEVATADLEEKVLGKMKPSDAEQVRIIGEQVKSIEDKTKSVILQNYGAFGGKVMAKLDDLGLYDVKKVLKKQLGVAERQYATLDSMVNQYNKKLDDINSKIDKSEDVKGSAGILYRRLQKMSEEMSTKKGELVEELKVAKEKAAASKEDTSYNTVRSEIRSLDSDIRGIESKTDKVASKIITQDGVIKSYNSQLQKFAYIANIAESALNRVEQRIENYKILIDQNLSPMTLMKVLGDVVKTGMTQDDVLTKINQYEGEAVDILGGMPKPGFTLTGAVTDSNEIGQKMVYRNDGNRALAEKILAEDVRL